MLSLVLACSHEKIIKDSSVSGSCDAKIKEIKLPPGQSVIDISKQATAGTMSIAITGVGATTDALMILLTNPLTKFTVCITAVAFVAAYSHGRYYNAGNDSRLCGEAIGSSTYNPKLAQKALDATQSWRCPNLDYVSEGLRSVASCYADKGEKEKARMQLESILNNKTIRKCISEKETDLIHHQILAI